MLLIHKHLAPANMVKLPTNTGFQQKTHGQRLHFCSNRFRKKNISNNSKHEKFAGSQIHFLLQVDLPICFHMSVGNKPPLAGFPSKEFFSTDLFWWKNTNNVTPWGVKKKQVFPCCFYFVCKLSVNSCKFKQWMKQFPCMKASKKVVACEFSPFCGHQRPTSCKSQADALNFLLSSKHFFVEKFQIVKHTWQLELETAVGTLRILGMILGHTEKRSTCGMTFDLNILKSQPFPTFLRLGSCGHAYQSLKLPHVW